MLIWIIGIIIVIIIGVVLIRWRVARRKRAMKVLMRHNQKACDEAVSLALTQLGVPADHELSSQPVADVWGHGIMRLNTKCQKLPRQSP